MKTIKYEEGSPHLIRRQNVYDDVMALYGDFERIQNEYPFRVAFDDEQAVDTGGVSRDMFSAFWLHVYKKDFDGVASLLPITHPHKDMSMFPRLGLIMSHGYLVCGFLPVKLAFPVIAAVLLGPTVSISSSILVRSFADYLSIHDGAILKEALQQPSEFSERLKANLIVVLSKFNCRKVPANRQQLKPLLAELARYELITKCLGALYALHSGVEHKHFWEPLSADDLFAIFNALNATAADVLDAIKEPANFCNNAEATVFGYLLQYVGNMKDEEVKNFLRFVTGSSCLVSAKIEVAFNGLCGTSRRPIAHTCNSVLELSVSYETYTEFAEEFTAVLCDEFSWIMDAM